MTMERINPSNPEIDVAFLDSLVTGFYSNPLQVSFLLLPALFTSAEQGGGRVHRAVPRPSRCLEARGQNSPKCGQSADKGFYLYFAALTAV
jgi:hypothetical protein